MGQYLITLFLENVDGIFHIPNNSHQMITRSFWISGYVFNAYSSRAIERARPGAVNLRAQRSKMIILMDQSESPLA